MLFLVLFETDDCKCSNSVSEHITSMCYFIVTQPLMIKISAQGNFQCPSIFKPIFFFLAEKTSTNARELIVDVVLSPIQKPALPIEEVIPDCGHNLFSI